MSSNIFPIAKFNTKFNHYLPTPIQHDNIYQSVGLKKHIEKRHPECIDFIPFIPYINNPDYIGINPNENGISFELVKTITKNIQIGIKLDTNEDYLYVATLHTITNAKLQHGIENRKWTFTKI